MLLVRQGQAAQGLLASKSRDSRHDLRLDLLCYPHLSSAIIAQHLQCNIGPGHWMSPLGSMVSKGVDIVCLQKP